jgi:hypothetical protein
MFWEMTEPYGPIEIPKADPSGSLFAANAAEAQAMRAATAQGFDCNLRIPMLELAFRMYIFCGCRKSLGGKLHRETLAWGIFLMSSSMLTQNPDLQPKGGAL